MDLNKMRQPVQPSSIEKFKLKKHLPRETSIFSTEVYAINLALDLITKSSNTIRIVFSDSQSAIVAIKEKEI